jgi:hypothetical protein
MRTMKSIKTTSSLPLKRLANSSRSQGVVEFALALPILLMLLFAIIDFSLLFSAWLLIQNMSRQAVRYAVTGEYNPIYCAAGCVDSADTDAARLLSIDAWARKFTPGLLLDNTAIANTEPGFMQVTICSTRDFDPPRPPASPVSDFQTILGVMGSTTQYSECLLIAGSTLVQDPGGPGDAVIVMVDFNHPYITPFLNQIWPMIHLVSAQRGIVEQFRVSRALSEPPRIFMGSPTASNTFVPTNTFTPSNTLTPSHTATMTFTPTPSVTVTPTPTPDCAAYEFTSGLFGLSKVGGIPRASLSIRNRSSTEDSYIENLTFDWEAYDANVPTQSLSRIRYGGTDITTSPINPGSSPSSWVLVGSHTASHDLLRGTTEVFDFDFLNADPTWPGGPYANSFGLVVHLGNNCDVSLAPQPTLTPTTTTSPTLTPTITTTGSPTYTPTRSLTPSITTSPTVTSTRTITSTPTITYTRTVTSTRTMTPTRTNTRTPTNTPSPSNTRTVTNTPTITRTPTVSNTPTLTRTPTVSSTPTLSPTRTSTRTITSTPTITRTPTLTMTRTATYTQTNTRTPTITFTPTRTNTPSSTFTPSNTATITFTRTITPTVSMTPTRTATQTQTPTATQITPSATRTPTVPPTATKCPTCGGYVEPPVLFSKSIAGSFIRSTRDSHAFHFALAN